MKLMILAAFALAATGLARAQSSAPFGVQSFPQFLAGSWQSVNRPGVPLTLVYRLNPDGSMTAEVQACRMLRGSREGCAKPEEAMERYAFDRSSSAWTISLPADEMARPSWPAAHWWHSEWLSFAGTGAAWQGTTWKFSGTSRRVVNGTAVSTRMVYTALGPDAFQIDWESLVDGSWDHRVTTFRRLSHE